MNFKKIASLQKWLVALALLLATFSRGGVPTTEPRPPIEVRFSPKGDCTKYIIACLDSATNSIFVQQFVLTSKPIIAALVSSRKKGVTVRCVLDARAAKGSSVLLVLRSGNVPVLLDAAHSIAHNKVIIIDSGLVLCGSFNASNAAEFDNAENLLTIRDAVIVQRFLGNFLLHEHHSK